MGDFYVAKLNEYVQNPGEIDLSKDSILLPLQLLLDYNTMISSSMPKFQKTGSKAGVSRSLGGVQKPMMAFAQGDVRWVCPLKSSPSTLAGVLPLGLERLYYYYIRSSSS